MLTNPGERTADTTKIPWWVLAAGAEVRMGAQFNVNVGIIYWNPGWNTGGLAIEKQQLASTPTPALSSSGVGERRVIDAGERQTLVLKSDGTLWAWGDNMFDQLGLNGGGGCCVPTQVDTETNWTALAADSRCALAIKSDGTLWAWGDNLSGQLGLGSGDYDMGCSIPTQVGAESDWATIVIGEGDHTHALKNDGTLWAWGNNTYGELGLGDTEDRCTPTQVGAENDWMVVAAGFSHTLALKNDGTLWAWGQNEEGQLGLDGSWDRCTPTQVGTESDWTSIAAGSEHTLALKNDGTLWSWGKNNDGQLGLGDTKSRTSPTRVGTQSDWAILSAGDRRTHALKNDGTFWTWGWNRYGQLGLGDYKNRFVPTLVDGP